MPSWKQKKELKCSLGATTELKCPLRSKKSQNSALLGARFGTSCLLKGQLWCKSGQSEAKTWQKCPLGSQTGIKVLLWRLRYGKQAYFGAKMCTEESSQGQYMANMSTVEQKQATKLPLRDQNMANRPTLEPKLTLKCSLRDQYMANVSTWEQKQATG